MGQYFKIVNEDKKEVINAWDLGGTAKFWEWLYNPQVRVFVWLLRKSDEGGGGDINDPEQFETLGRWAGDRITLIGDYDSSRLWNMSETKDADGNLLPNATYTDISALVRKEFNDAIRKDGGHSEEL